MLSPTFGVPHFNFQIRETVKDLIGRELDATLYPQLFQLLKEYVDKFFDPNLQVRIRESSLGIA